MMVRATYLKRMTLKIKVLLLMFFAALLRCAYA